MARPYFTLAVREDGLWAPQFGDFDRDVVKAEVDDFHDHDVKMKDMKIVKSKSSKTVDVDAEIAKLNAARSA